MSFGTSAREKLEHPPMYPSKSLYVPQARPLDSAPIAPGSSALHAPQAGGDFFVERFTSEGHSRPTSTTCLSVLPLPPFFPSPPLLTPSTSRTASPPLRRDEGGYPKARDAA